MNRGSTLSGLVIVTALICVIVLDNLDLTSSKSQGGPVGNRASWCHTGFNCLEPGQIFRVQASHGDSLNDLGAAVCVPKKHTIAAFSPTEVHLAYKANFKAKYENKISHQPQGNAGVAWKLKKPLRPVDQTGEVIPSIKNGKTLFRVPQRWEKDLRILPERYTRRCAWIWVTPKRAEQGGVDFFLLALKEEEVRFPQ